MKKVIILKGLPASGKTTWAKNQIDKNPGMYKRINKDEIRAMLDNSKWSGDNEKFVVKTRDWLIVEALHSGHHVIIDDTNLDPKHEVRIRQLVKENDTTAGVRIMDFDVDLQEAVRRDAKRENSVGQKVITDMYFKYLYKPEKYVGPAGKPEAIIVDIDGTLAKMNGRSPYDYSLVHTDLVNEPIAELVYYMSEPAGHQVIIVTGRDGSCEEETKQWLRDNDIPFDAFFIRPAGNKEKDSIIKKRIFEENIKDNYQIKFVLDDRDQVVEMWRSLGLTCLQVGYGNF